MQKTFGALDWLALLTTHIPDKNEQMDRYYGYYSNKSRGLRKKEGKDNDVPALIDSGISRKGFRKIGRAWFIKYIMLTLSNVQNAREKCE